MSPLAALETQRDEFDQVTQQLQRRIHQKEYVMSNEITVKRTPTVAVAAHRTPTTYTTIFEDIPAGFATVIANLADAGVDPSGIPSTLYHQAPDADTPGVTEDELLTEIHFPIDAEGDL